MDTVSRKPLRCLGCREPIAGVPARSPRSGAPFHDACLAVVNRRYEIALRALAEHRAGHSVNRQAGREALAARRAAKRRAAG